MKIKRKGIIIKLIFIKWSNTRWEQYNAIKNMENLALNKLDTLKDLKMQLAKNKILNVKGVKLLKHLLMADGVCLEDVDISKGIHSNGFLNEGLI